MITNNRSGIMEQSQAASVTFNGSVGAGSSTVRPGGNWFRNQANATITRSVYGSIGGAYGNTTIGTGCTLLHTFEVRFEGTTTVGEAGFTTNGLANKFGLRRTAANALVAVWPDGSTSALMAASVAGRIYRCTLLANARALSVTLQDLTTLASALARFAAAANYDMSIYLQIVGEAAATQYIDWREQYYAFVQA